MREFITYIDQIIDVIQRNSSLTTIKCHPVDRPYVLLTCKGEQFHSRRDLQYWLNYVKFPRAYVDTDCSLQYEWIDTRDGETTVPAEFYSSNPPEEPDWWDEEENGEFMPEDSFWEGHDNTYGPWVLSRYLVVKLWFKIPEVGLPEKWDRNCKYIYKNEEE